MSGGDQVIGGAVANKKSISKVVRTFNAAIDEQEQFVARAEEAGLTSRQLSLVYEMSLIKVVSALELLVLESLVTVMNRESAAVRQRHGVRIPAHMTDDMCEFLIIRNGYFSFGDRSALIKRLKEFLPNDHWLVRAIRDHTHSDTFDRMMALRHLAAHNSKYSLRNAKEKAGVTRLAGAGVWYRAGRRYPSLLRSVRDLASAVEEAAPY